MLCYVMSGLRVLLQLTDGGAYAGHRRIRLLGRSIAAESLLGGEALMGADICGFIV